MRPTATAGKGLKSESEIRSPAVEAPHRRIGSKLAIALASVVLGLVLAEVVLRLLGIGQQGMYQWDAARGWSLRPLASGWRREEGNGFVRINRDGMRDREYPYQRPANTIRMAFIGDSFTEGEQVAVEDDFVSIVERGLGTCERLRGKNVETLNFGCDSYSTAQEFITLRRKVWKYSPDIVVLLFFAGNDIRNNSRSLEWHLCQPFFLLHGDWLVLGGPFIDSPVFRAECAIKFESRRSAVLNVVGDSVARIRSIIKAKKALLAERESKATEASQPTAAPQPAPAAQPAAASKSAALSQPKAAPSVELGLTDIIYKAPQDAIWDDAWKVTEKLILAIDADVKAHGAQFLAVTATAGPQVYPDPVWRAQYAQSLDVKDLFYPDQRLKELGARGGFDVLNLAPAFQTYADAHHAFLHGFANTKMGIGHWNEAGHHLAGELIANRLCHLIGGAAPPGQTTSTKP